MGLRYYGYNRTCNEQEKEIDREDVAYRTAITTTQDIIIELLEDLGDVPEDLETKIRSEEDMTALKRWLKLSAQAESVEAFIKSI